MKDRLRGCRKAIRVNRITVTAFGWLQLFKTRLRMGNFLSRSILGTPTFGSSRSQSCCFFFHRGRGRELFLLFLHLSVFLGGFERLRSTCIAPLLAFLPYIINNPLRFPQSKGRDRKKLAVCFFLCVCACLSEYKYIMLFMLWTI